MLNITIFGNEFCCSFSLWLEQSFTFMHLADIFFELVFTNAFLIIYLIFFSAYTSCCDRVLWCISGILNKWQGLILARSWLTVVMFRVRAPSVWRNFLRVCGRPQTKFWDRAYNSSCARKTGESQQLYCACVEVGHPRSATVEYIFWKLSSFPDAESDVHPNKYIAQAVKLEKGTPFQRGSKCNFVFLWINLDLVHGLIVFTTRLVILISCRLYILVTNSAGHCVTQDKPVSGKRQKCEDENMMEAFWKFKARFTN